MKFNNLASQKIYLKYNNLTVFLQIKLTKIFIQRKKVLQYLIDKIDYYHNSKSKDKN